MQGFVDGRLLCGGVVRICYAPIFFPIFLRSDYFAPIISLRLSFALIIFRSDYLLKLSDMRFDYVVELVRRCPFDNIFGPTRL